MRAIFKWMIQPFTSSEQAIEIVQKTTSQRLQVNSESETRMPSLVFRYTEQILFPEKPKAALKLSKWRETTRNRREGCIDWHCTFCNSIDPEGASMSSDRHQHVSCCAAARAAALLPSSLQAERRGLTRRVNSNHQTERTLLNSP